MVPIQQIIFHRASHPYGSIHWELPTDGVLFVFVGWNNIYASITTHHKCAERECADRTVTPRALSHIIYVLCFVMWTLNTHITRVIAANLQMIIPWKPHTSSLMSASWLQIYLHVVHTPQHTHQQNNINPYFNSSLSVMQCKSRWAQKTCCSKRNKCNKTSVESNIKMCVPSSRCKLWSVKKSSGIIFSINSRAACISQSQDKISSFFLTTLLHL